MAISISSFSPMTAKLGEVVTIKGTNLNTVTTVQFGGITADYFIYDATSGDIFAFPDATSVSGNATILDGVGGTYNASGFVFLNWPTGPAIVPPISITGTAATITEFYQSGNTYYNFISPQTGEYFTVNSISSIPGTFVPDNICYFAFPGGLYGERNWTDNRINALEFGINGNGTFDNGPALSKFFQYLSLGNKIGLIPKDPLHAPTVYLTFSELKITGSNITLYIEADLKANYSTSPVVVSPANLISVKGTSSAYLSNVRIIGDGNTLDLMGINMTWSYTTGVNYCTVFFQYVTDGLVENLVLLNGLVGCIKMNYCLRPVMSNITAMGSIYDNGISISFDPATATPTDTTTYANGLIINCKAMHCQDFGITSFASGYTRIINCESWNCGSCPPKPTLTETTGGAVPAGYTYYYMVTALVTIGGVAVERNLSDEANVAVGTGYNAVQVVIANIVGAVSYNIYRSTATGTETLLGNVTDSSSGHGTGTTTYNDYAMSSGSTLPPANSVQSGGGFSDEIDFTTSGANLLNNVLFENCKAFDCVTNGLFSSSRKVRIIGLVVDNTNVYLNSNPFEPYHGQGISLYGNSDFIIENCDTRNIAKCGISSIHTPNVPPTGTPIIPASYVGGIISNCNIENCGNGGINLQGCTTLVNCFDNNLNGTNTRNATNSAELTVANFGTIGGVNVPGQGTAVIKDNKFTAPVALSVFVQDLNYVFVENNIIENSTVDGPITVYSRNNNVGYVTIKGNSMRNSATSLLNLAYATAIFPTSFVITGALAVGNNGDYTSPSGINLSLGTGGQGIINGLTFVPNNNATTTTSYKTNLAQGDLLILPILTANNTIHFPAVVAGKVILVWVTNNSTFTWSVFTGTGYVPVYDGTGTAITTLSNGVIYRFIGYPATAYSSITTPAWFRIS